uniref:DNA polymerase epsilon catalytic subunit n=1 Tax=Romanomermis culicivorax TaxID=13658 RepID=A0A915IBM5_ROMCU
TYLELCRYLHIPVGNVPADFAQFGADLFYARHLQRHNFVLWASPTDRPDLGGKEVDNNSYCVEFDVASLPVAAILQSHKISELEGVHAATGFDYGQAQYGIDQMIGGSKNMDSNSSSSASYDETALCTHAFRILKNVVNSWVRDVANYSNRFADNQIIHFYRWLRSNSSLLYEPALKKILNSLMKKLFLLEAKQLF